MSERLSIICTCGYETLVRPEQLGQTVECFMCGADLEVDEASVTDHHNVPEPEEGESDSAGPESPIEAGGHPSMPDPETTYEEAEEQERSPKKYRSPFEEEDETPEYRRPIEESRRREADESEPSASAPESGAPSQRPGSPFEDAEDEEAERDTEARGPFTLEASPESKQDTSFSNLMEEVRPKDRRNRSVVIPTESPHDQPTGETCSECGRPIRGSWDRIEMPEGVICYICSNQATHDLPQRMKEDRPGPRELGERDLIVDHGPPAPPEPEVPWWKDPESDRFRQVVAGLAFATLAFAVIVYLTGWGTPSETAGPATAIEAEPEIEVAGWVTFVVWSWRVVAGLLGVWGALYLTLDRDKRLPYDRFLNNAVYIGIIMGILTLLSAALFVISAILNTIFVAGIIWMMLFSGLAILAQFVILINLLDFRIRDFLWLYLFYLPVSQFLVQGVGMFLGWGLYEIAT